MFWRKVLEKRDTHSLCYTIFLIKEDEMSRACSTNRGEEECIQDIGGKARKEETTRKTRCTWVDSTEMDLREIRCGGMDWINLLVDRDQWRALVKMAMNLQVPQTVGEVLE
jgi:hypothetical protein